MVFFPRCLWESPLVLVMHRCCGRFLLSKPRTKYLRPASSTATSAAAESATPLPRPNALILIHRTSALLPSALSPTPKHPVESLELWTKLLDYAHNASVVHNKLGRDESPRARIVDAFILRLSSRPSTFSFLASHSPPLSKGRSANRSPMG